MKSIAIIFFSILFFIVIPWFWLKSYKYWFFSFNNFESEILAYLEENDLQFLEARKLSETNDAGSSPFETKDTNSLSCYLLTTLYNHQFLRVKTKNGKEIYYWFRAQARFFGEIKYEFIPTVLNEEKIIKKEKLVLGNNCPACDTTISKGDKSCSNCGLDFNIS